MVTYNVEVIRPGVTTGAAQIEREYTEDELKDALESLEGTRVTDEARMTTVDSVIGEVTDVRYQNGVQCTVDIFDDEMAERIDEGLASLAPSMSLSSNNNEDPVRAEDIEFRHLFLAPETSELVGLTEREE